MEIDHVLTSAAEVERDTTHSWCRPAARCTLRAERRAIPLVRGGASNHGSWRKNMVNSNNLIPCN